MYIVWFVDIPWKNCDACAITVPASPQYCKHHGVYKIDKEVRTCRTFVFPIADIFFLNNNPDLLRSHEVCTVNLMYDFPKVLRTIGFGKVYLLNKG